MLRPFAALILCCFGAVLARGDYELAPAGWGLHATFPAEPKSDDYRTPTPQGEEVAERRFLERNGERFMAVRVIYPFAPSLAARSQLYAGSIQALMNSRSGQIREDQPFELGEYRGQRIVIEHRREKTHREVRLVLIGSSLYMVSAEWPGAKTPSPAAARFFASLRVPATYANARVVEERERWRELVQGSFKLRYDATRWFPDPEAAEPNSIVLLRVDELAEAEFVSTVEPNPGPSMEETVLARARETAESVKLLRRGRKMRDTASFEELRFAVRFEGITYENHGYFYSGPEGTAQVRAWSTERNFARVEGDIAELLEGLSVQRGSSSAAAAAR